MLQASMLILSNQIKLHDLLFKLELNNSDSTILVSSPNTRHFQRRCL